MIETAKSGKKIYFERNTRFTAKKGSICNVDDTKINFYKYLLKTFKGELQ